MSTSKSHMYTANVWCCTMLNIIDVYFKVTHVYIKRVIFYIYCTAMCDVVICWILSRCLLQSHDNHCIQSNANVWSCNMWNIIDVYIKVTHVYSKCVNMLNIVGVYFKVTYVHSKCVISYMQKSHMCDLVICWI